MTATRLRDMTPDEIFAAVRSGKLDPLPLPIGRGGEWALAQLARWRETWPAGHDDEPAAGEVRVLVALAERADKRGVAVVSRVYLTAAARLRSKEVGAAFAWLHWRGSLVSARRVSEEGTPRVDRVQLSDWPHEAPGVGAPGSVADHP